MLYELESVRLRCSIPGTPLSKYIKLLRRAYQYDYSTILTIVRVRVSIRAEGIFGSRTHKVESSIDCPCSTCYEELDDATDALVVEAASSPTDSLPVAQLR